MPDIRSLLLDTPLGMLRIAGTDRGITDVTFAELPQESGAPYPHLTDAKRQIYEYFEGKRTTFDSLPLLLEASDFTLAVWDSIAGIPYGRTKTYGEIASGIDRDKAVRAVGSACGRNRIGIIIPCHRVVPSGGGIGGFGWGSERKEWLLRFEKGDR